MRPIAPRAAAAVALAVAPWLWFLVRDAHPWLDAVALAWPVLGLGGAAALAVVAVVMRRDGPGLAAASWLLATALVVLGPWRPLDTGEPVAPMRVVAANTYGQMTSPESVLPPLLAQRADLLVVVEVSDSADAVLATRFAHRLRRAGVGVYSSQPLRLVRPAPAAQRGLVAVVGSGGDRFMLYALHLQKPGLRPSKVEVGFRTHRRLVDTAADAVERETLPVVVAGDLNLVDRSGGYRRLTGVLDDAMRAGWAGPTSLRTATKPLMARIDHVLMPSSWCSADSELFGLPGSDHRGVAVSTGRCR